MTALPEGEPSVGPSLPLPLGEVAERSEDGEGTRCPKTLSVTFGDSSPSGRAKGLLQAGGADLASKKFLQIRYCKIILKNNGIII